MNYIEAKILKSEFPDYKLLYIEIGTHEYVVRDISQEEYREATMLSESNEELQDIVCQIGVVHPQGLSFNNYPMSGHNEILYDQIIKASMFKQNEMISLYKKYSKEQTTFKEQAMALIKCAMPEYSFDLMKTWPSSKLMKEATRAEFMLKEIRQLNIEWKLPEEGSVEKQKEDDVEDICDELAKQGFNPILQLWSSLRTPPKEVQRPFIGGFHWRNEAIISAIRQQLNEPKF